MIKTNISCEQGCFLTFVASIIIMFIEGFAIMKIYNFFAESSLNIWQSVGIGLIIDCVSLVLLIIFDRYV